MRLIEAFFTAVGLIVCIFLIAGSLGIGHFNLYYGEAKVSCTKETP